MSAEQQEVIQFVLKQTPFSQLDSSAVEYFVNHLDSIYLTRDNQSQWLSSSSPKLFLIRSGLYELIDEFEISDWTMNELLSVYELCFCSFARPMLGVVESIIELHDSGYLLGLISNGMSPFQERAYPWPIPAHTAFTA